MAARPSGIPSRGSARSLPKRGAAPAGHRAGFSAARTAPIVHIGGESECNGEEELKPVTILAIKMLVYGIELEGSRTEV